MHQFQSDRSNTIFLKVFSGAGLLSVAFAWIYASYFDGNFPALLVYFGQDNNCETVTQGLGIHCFGDYSAIHFSSFFQLPQGAEVVYPLVTRIFRLPFLLIELMSGYRIGLFVYLVTLFIAIMFPAFHMSYKQRGEPALAAMYSVAGIGVGTISCLDRGNVIGFAVPFLYLFLIKFQGGNSRTAAIFLTIATLVKPQIAVFAIAFLWQSEIRVFIRFAFRTFLLLVAPYFIFGTQSLQIFGDWIRETLKWANSLPPAMNYPTNYSFNRVLGVLGVNFPIFSFLLGLFFLFGLSLPYINKKREILLDDLIKLGLVMILMNSIVYVYYMVLIVPLCALLFTTPESVNRDRTKLGNVLPVLAILLAFATVPLAWPSQWRIADTISSTTAYNQIPILVTLSMTIYIALTVVNNVLDSFKRQDY